MALLKQINKTKFLIPYEHLYIESHHYHKQLIPEQNSSEYNPMYQLPHPTEPPDLHPPPKPNKPVDPQLATSQHLQVHATHTKNC
jgi:hypothetical protein